MLRCSSGDGVVSIGRCWAWADVARASTTIAGAKGNVLIFAIPVNGDRRRRFRLNSVGGRPGMPELLAPAVGDQAGEAEPDQAVERPGPGKAQVLDQGPA